MSKARPPFPDSQKVKIKDRFTGEKLVPYHEVRLGIHDPKMEESVCKEALLRMGTDREATCRQIKKERATASAIKQAKAMKEEKPKKKDKTDI